MKQEAKMKKSAVRHYCRVALAALMVLIGARYCSAQTLTISAAASMKNALTEVENTYRQDHASVKFANNFGSSGTLAAQIDQGAPVDILLAAAARPMNMLQARGLIISSTRRNLLSNTLVLIAPLGSKLKSFQGLTKPSVRTVALGDPGNVPAGMYGKQTLVSLKLYNKLKRKIVLGKDVREVLAYVETGNADAGLVYATDAKISSRVRVVVTAPESTHKPIIYPVAVVKGSRSVSAARKFIAYMATPPAQAIFVKYGFGIAGR